MTIYFDHLVNGSIENATRLVFEDNPIISLGYNFWIIPILAIVAAIWIKTESGVIASIVGVVLSFGFYSIVSTQYALWLTIFFIVVFAGMIVDIYLATK